MQEGQCMVGCQVGWMGAGSVRKPWLTGSQLRLRGAGRVCVRRRTVYTPANWDRAWCVFVAPQPACKTRSRRVALSDICDEGLCMCMWACRGTPSTARAPR